MIKTNIEKQVKETLDKINLSKKEKILVAISGGKDSAVTAYLLSKLGYNIEGLFIDLGTGKYSNNCKKNAQELCNRLKIKLNIYDLKKESGSSIKEYWKKTKNKNLCNCVVCGIIKKDILNKEARKLKFDKIATGHHLNDESTTFIMNILKGSPQLSFNSGVLTKKISFAKIQKFVPRLKILFYIDEKDIKKYAIKKKLIFSKEICPYRNNPYRIQIKNFIDNLSKKERKNIIKNFEKLKPKIKKLSSDKMNFCELCGEICRKKICKKCSLIK